MTALVGGIGLINVDLLYSGLKRIPKLGEEVYSERFSMELGGGVVATLINLSRLGIKSEIITLLGNDTFSEFAKKTIKTFAVDICNLYTGSIKIPITLTSVMTLENDRSFISYCDNEAVKIFVLNQDEIYSRLKNCKIVCMSYGLLEVYKKLKENGVILILDTGWEDNLNLEMYHEYLQVADYYVPNRKEALKITGKNTVTEAADVLQRYFTNVIIKLDKEGCLLKNEHGCQLIEPIYTEKLVDATGAGDAFLSGLIYGICHDYPIEECIVFGNIAGGTCVTGIGALSSFITEAKMLELSKKLQLRKF